MFSILARKSEVIRKDVLSVGKPDSVGCIDALSTMVSGFCLGVHPDRGSRPAATPRLHPAARGGALPSELFIRRIYMKRPVTLAVTESNPATVANSRHNLPPPPGPVTYANGESVFQAWQPRDGRSVGRLRAAVS